MTKKPASLSRSAKRSEPVYRVASCKTRIANITTSTRIVKLIGMENINLR